MHERPEEMSGMPQPSAPTSILPTRFHHTVVGEVVGSSQSAFAGSDEQERMNKARTAIASVRASWSDREQYNRRVADIRSFLDRTSKTRAVPPNVVTAIIDIVQQHNSYADMQTGYADCKNYAALRLYLSDEGYNFLFALVSSLLRSETIKTDELVTITTLVEYLTIDLYNLRLANINNEAYRDYTGTVYRGMSVPASVVDDFRAIAQRPVLTERNFSIPLAMISSTKSRRIMEEFAGRGGLPDHLYWIIHIRGIRPDLAQRYFSRYPDSVVSSICAMSVASVSAFSEEDEVLLRGPFFQMLRMTTEDLGGKRAHWCEMLMLNANRDHGTELSSNDGEKALQRALFGNIVRATRYDACATVAAQWSVSESEEYRRLAEKELQTIHEAEVESSSSVS